LSDPKAAAIDKVMNDNESNVLPLLEANLPVLAGMLLDGQDALKTLFASLKPEDKFEDSDVPKGIIALLTPLSDSELLKDKVVAKGEDLEKTLATFLKKNPPVLKDLLTKSGDGLKERVLKDKDLFTKLLTSREDYKELFEKMTGGSVDSVDKELLFLEKLCLVFKEDDKRFISPLAYVLYAPDGLLSTDIGTRMSSLLRPEDKATFLQSFLNLMAQFTLPGLLAAASSVEDALVSDVNPGYRLEQQRREIESTIQKIRGIF